MSPYDRERLTGRPVWIEVKDYNNKTLRLNPRLQGQLGRMAQFEGRRILVCRGTVAPEVKALAAMYRIMVYEQVRFADLPRLLVREQIVAARVGGGASMGAGAFLVLVSAHRGYDYLTDANWTIDGFTGRALTSDFLLGGPGIAFFGQGVIQWTQSGTAAESLRTRPSGTASPSTQLSAGSGGNWARGLGRGGWMLAGGFAVHEGYRMYERDIDPRTGTVQLSGLGGATAGGLAGAKVGAVIGGMLTGPAVPVGAFGGGVVGGIIGGVGGFFVGGAAGDVAYDRFKFSDAEFVKRKQQLLESSLQ